MKMIAFMFSSAGQDCTRLIAQCYQNANQVLYTLKMFLPPDAADRIPALSNNGFQILVTVYEI